MLYTSYFYSVLSYKNPTRVCDVSERFACTGKQKKTCVYTTDCMLLLKQGLLWWKLCIYSVCPFVCLWLVFLTVQDVQICPVLLTFIQVSFQTVCLPLKSLIFCLNCFFLFCIHLMFYSRFSTHSRCLYQCHIYVSVCFNSMMLFNSM